MKHDFEIKLSLCNENIDTAIDLLSGVKLVGTEVIPEFIKCASSFR